MRRPAGPREIRAHRQMNVTIDQSWENRGVREIDHLRGRRQLLLDVRRLSHRFDPVAFNPDHLVRQIISGPHVQNSPGLHSHNRRRSSLLAARSTQMRCKLQKAAQSQIASSTPPNVAVTRRANRGRAGLYLYLQAGFVIFSRPPNGSSAHPNTSRGSPLARGGAHELETFPPRHPRSRRSEFVHRLAVRRRAFPRQVLRAIPKSGDKSSAKTTPARSPGA